MRNIVYVLALLVLLTISYFIYDGYIATARPCEQIFQQTSLNFKTKVQILEDNVSFDVGKNRIQTLSESSQKVAINLQACCIAAKTGGVDYLQCQSAANDFETKFAALDKNVNDKKTIDQRVTLGQSTEIGLKTEKRTDGTKSDKPSETIVAGIVAPQPQNAPIKPVKYISLREEVDALINDARITSSKLNQNIKANNLER